MSALAVFAPSTHAAQPKASASYFGFNGQLRDFNSDQQSTLTAVLRTSSSGRNLTGRRGGSKVFYRFRCASDRSGRVSGWLRLVPRGRRGPAIRAGGSFRAAQRRGRVRFSLRGRFVSPDAIGVAYRISRPPRRAKHSRRARCRSPHTRVALRKDGEPGFTGCRTQQATNVLSSPEGRIFYQLRFNRFLGFDSRYFLRYAYGCLYSTNRRFELGLDDGAEAEGATTGLFALAGPYVAYQSICFSLGCNPWISVVDLRTGEEFRSFRPTDDPPISEPPAVDLVLKANGSTAWVTDRQTIYGLRRTPAVWVWDSLGYRRLDSGGAIDRESLALNGSVLTWRHGDQTRSATLH